MTQAKTAYELYLECEDKSTFVSEKALEWGLSPEEVLTILLNTCRIKREPSYPALVDQLDMLYHDIKNKNLESGNWITAIDQVKQQFPKVDQ